MGEVVYLPTRKQAPESASGKNALLWDMIGGLISLAFLALQLLPFGLTFASWLR
ncbi:hypothetical protein BH10PSE9_BH10PSE9_02520 [soil metagenome]